MTIENNVKWAAAYFIALKWEILHYKNDLKTYPSDSSSSNTTKLTCEAFFFKMVQSDKLPPCSVCVCVCVGVSPPPTESDALSSHFLNVLWIYIGSNWWHLDYVIRYIYFFLNYVILKIAVNYWFLIEAF